MPVTTEERTAKLEGMMEQMDKRLTNIETEVVRIHTRIDQVITQTNSGFEKMNTRIDQVITLTNSGFEKMNTRIDQVNTRIDQKFNWVMGIMITMWISLIITMLFK